MKRSFSLRDAAVLAVLLHLAVFLLDYWTQGKLAGVFTAVPESVAEARDPMEFRFTDAPPEEQKPEPSQSKTLSDRELRARTPERAEKPSEQPRIAGRSPHEFTFPSRPPQPLPKPLLPPREPKWEESREAPREEGEGETAKQEEAAPDFRERVDEFMRSIVAEGFRNPDGSVSALGRPTFDTAEFDFGPYARRLYWKVRSNWQPSPIMSYLGRTWEAVIEFDIARDGTVENLRVVRESGIPAYDREALYAILASYPLEKLPDGYPHDRVGVRWHFYYHVYQR